MLIEPRIYRAALLPAVVAVLVLMFSLESHAPPLAQAPAADVLFEGRAAAGEASQIAAAHPDRRAGSRGDRATGEAVARAFQARGLHVTVDAWEAGGRRLVNVIGRRAGASRREIVVMAGRDAPVGPDLRGSAADTAALLEVARVLEGRASRKTLVLASVDGAALGEAGARRFAETEPERDQIDAVLVLSNLGAGSSSAPPLVGWSNDGSRGGLGLARTAAASLALETGSPPPQDGAFDQLVAQAVPLGIGAQGPLLARGMEAIRLSGSGALPAPPAGGALDPERYGEFGSAALRTVTALDAAAATEPGMHSYIVVAGQVVPAWALSMLALALILAPLVAGVDALARARRRGEPVARWMAWVMAGALPFLLGLLVAHLLAAAGVGPPPAPAPSAPGASSPEATGAVVLGLVALAVTLAWTVGRPWLATRATTGRPPLGDPSSPGAGVAAALVLGVAALVAWALNPFAGLLLAPLANLAALAMLTAARPRAGAGLLAVGLVPPAAAAALYMDRLSLDPLAAASYAFGLFTGGHAGAVTMLLGCVILGAVGSTVAVLIGRSRARDGAQERSAVSATVRRERRPAGRARRAPARLPAKGP